MTELSIEQFSSCSSHIIGEHEPSSLLNGSSMPHSALKIEIFNVIMKRI